MTSGNESSDFEATCRCGRVGVVAFIEDDAIWIEHGPDDRHDHRGQDLVELRARMKRWRCAECGSLGTTWTIEPYEELNDDGAVVLNAYRVTNHPCGHASVTADPHGRVMRVPA